MTLKTLKDIEFGRTETEDRAMLKQEAIKWIKSSEEFESFLEFTTSMEEITKGDFLKGWIKHFFNIIEEDLK